MVVSTSCPWRPPDLQQPIRRRERGAQAGHLERQLLPIQLTKELAAMAISDGCFKRNLFRLSGSTHFRLQQQPLALIINTQKVAVARTGNTDIQLTTLITA